MPAGSESSRPTGTIVATNMNDNTATVIDAASGRVLATLPTGEGPHEVAASNSGRWAVVTNYGVRGKAGSTLSVIDLQQLAVSNTIDLAPAQRPHGIRFLAGDSLLAITSEASQAVLIVRFPSGEVIRRLPTSGRASHMLAIAQGGSRIFTTNIVDGAISDLDISGAAPANVMKVARFVEGITITPDGKQVWVGSNGDSIVVVIDAARGVPLDTLRGFGLPYRLGITPDSRTAVISDPMRGEIRIYDVATRRERSRIVVPRDSLVATAEVPGSPSPEGVAVSGDSRWAFVTLQGRNRVATIDLVSGTIVGLAPTGTWSDGVTWSPLVHRQ